MLADSSCNKQQTSFQDAKINRHSISFYNHKNTLIPLVIDLIVGYTVYREEDNLIKKLQLRTHGCAVSHRKYYSPLE